MTKCNGDVFCYLEQEGAVICTSWGYISIVYDDFVVQNAYFHMIVNLFATRKCSGRDCAGRCGVHMAVSFPIVYDNFVHKCILT